MAKEVRRGKGGELTAGRRCLGVSEQHNAGLALVNELLEARLLAVVGLDLAAEALQVDDIAHGDLLAVLLLLSLGDVLLGLGRRSARDSLLDLVGDLGSGLLGLAGRRLGLGRRLLLGSRGRGRRRRGRLALAQLDGHDDDDDATEVLEGVWCSEFHTARRGRGGDGDGPVARSCAREAEGAR